MFKTGFESLKGYKSNNNINTESSNNMIIGRVIDVINDETHPLYSMDNNGIYNIGTIIFSQYSSTPFNENTITYPAKRFNSNIKKFPEINEIVYIFTIKIQVDGRKNIPAYFYLDTINIWNTNHINILPDNTSLKTKSNLTNIEEDGNVRSVKINQGEIAYEGRWNNSLILGNSKYNKSNFFKSKNNSYSILLNNTSTINELQYFTNIDESNDSIICLSKDTINTTLTIPFYSVVSKIKQLNEYDDDQILLKSKRIFLYSNTNEIITYSKKGTYIGSEEDINIETLKVITLQSERTNLSGKDSNIPVMYGDKTNELLNTLIKLLIELTQTLSQTVSTEIGTPLGEINIKAQEVNLILSTLKELTESKNLLSKNIFI